MYRVLVADDHAVVRKGIVQILQDTGDISVDGEAASGEEAIAAALAGQWDAVVLDLNLPDISGVEVLEQVHAVRPELRILVLSIHPEEQYAVRLLRAGAYGYLAKESAPAEFIEAVRRVCRGSRYISARLSEILALASEKQGGALAHERLSKRELEVLQLLGGGFTISSIADQLGVSIKTVSTYRTRVLEKLALTTNAELVRYAVEHRLLLDV